MNLNASKFIGRLRFSSLPLLVGLLLLPRLALGTDSIASFTQTNIYIPGFYGNTIPYPPQVDATNFYNSGLWEIYTGNRPPYYYQTANTLNYTNYGTMIGYSGWVFDFGPYSGSRSLSASFYNANGGDIEADDNYIYDPPNLTSLGLNPTLESRLWISATNIVNRGTLGAGAGGEIVLTGTNVDLYRSTLYIGAIPELGSSNGTNSYTPDTALYDEYWQQTSTFPNSTTPYGFNSAGIWRGTNNAVLSPTFYVDWLQPQPTCVEPNVGLNDGFYSSLSDSTNIESYMFMTNIVVTNQDGITVVTNHEPTKIARQAVFVGIGDIYIIPDDRFYPNSDNVSNLYQTITVSLTSALTGDSLYLEDTFGALTNRGLLLNSSGNTGNNPLSSCTDPTYRPANYVLSRAPLRTFTGGAKGLGPPSTNFLYDPTTFTNLNSVQASYAAYNAYVANLLRSPTNSAVTNLPGRIIINADKLNLTDATIYNQAGAEVAIQANNFQGSTGAVVSCQNLSFNLATPSGHLNVTNLVNSSSVPGMNGNVYAWSALWTNGITTGIFTNYYYVTNTVGTNTVGVLTNNLITNIAEIDFHVLLVDATELRTAVPVMVQNLILNSTNMMVSDPNITVTNSLLFDGQSLTLQGGLTLGGALQHWNSSITPTWLYFTNNGTLTVPENARFGDGGPTNYAAFVNNGTIKVGGAETVNSDFYQSGGSGSSENAPGGYTVTTSVGKLQGADIATSSGSMSFTANSLKLDNSTLSARYALNFYVPNSTNTSLYDSGGSGGSAHNLLTCGDGFNLPVKPKTGDLLGTAITSEAFNGGVVSHVWAGEDRGPTPAGYSNNAALGQLILSPVGSSRYPAQFDFSPPGGSSGTNALYVDLLDLSQITNLAEMVETDPHFVIYYAAAKLPPSITVLNSNGVPVQEVETNDPLNGQSYYVVANGGSGQVWQEAEEVLNGQLGGHLRWVSSFAGPNSSVDVLINHQTYSVNRALRYSLAIDSNGDGIPNGVDPSPFGAPPLVVSGAVLQTILPPEKSFAVTWLAETNIPYQVQYSTNLSGTNWLPLLNYTNTTTTNRTVTVYDTNAVSGQRFYRVSHPSP